MTQATKTRKQTEINAASIARVSSKDGQFLGYLVKSNSSENYYQVTYNTSANRYECNCASTCKCCHLRAVAEVQAVRFAKPVARGEAPVCSELKTSFSSIEEEYEYRLHAYGKRSAIGWMYEQKQHTTVEVVASGQAEQVAAVAEVQAEAKMDAFKRGMDEQYASDPRRGLSQGEMEAARSNMVHLYDEY